MTAQLDHIILLVPHETLRNPPSWATDNFTLAPGGKHADGLTENKLILFRDGTYLELVAFVDDDEKRKEGHWWGKKRLGLSDWAVTFPITAPPDSSGDSIQVLGKEIDKHFADLSEGVWKLQAHPDEIAADKNKKKIAYADPAAGGRILADGSETRWKVAFPRLGNNPPPKENTLTLPFLCYDLTARHLRVPVSDEKLLTHPCGATGIDQVGLLVSKEERENIGPLMASVLNSSQRPAVARELHTTTQFEVGTPSSSQGKPATVVLMTPLTASETKRWELDRAGSLTEITVRVGKTDDKVPMAIRDEENGITIKFREADE